MGSNPILGFFLHDSSTRLERTMMDREMMVQIHLVYFEWALRVLKDGGAPRLWGAPRIENTFARSASILFCV